MEVMDANSEDTMPPSQLWKIFHFNAISFPSRYCDWKIK